MRCFFLSRSLTFALCGHGRNKSERSLEREGKWFFPWRCLPRAMLTGLQCFSSWCHGALASRKTYSSGLQSHGAGGKILQQSGEELSRWLDQDLTPPYPLIPCISSARGSMQGFNHEGRIQGTVFSIKMGCRAKRNLFFLSYFPHR